MPGNSPSSNKKPQKKAVALRYDKSQESAPVVIGKGLGLLADKIIALAKENNIPIHQDHDLVEILSHMDLNQEIPPDTYILVAEILAFIYRANQSYTQPSR